MALLIVDKGWRFILRELICEGADLHSADLMSRTPFMSLLEGICDSKWNDDAIPHLEIQNHWLSDLRDCEVDLYEYGRREEEIYRDGSVSREIEIWKDSSSFRIWKLVSFTYGSSPSDWHLQLERGPKELVGQCEQVQEIPGSWVEDSISV